jgi:glycosyltransferase involved in cell wall biosynthesis
VTPRVTVLVPIYNNAPYLRAAIDSVLAQTLEDFELLLIDDASADESRAIAASYTDPRVRLIVHEQNRGLAATLNHGLELARGELIARQDADDLSVPGRLARQCGFLSDHPDVALVGSLAFAIDQNNRPAKPVDRPIDEVSIRWYALLDNPFIHSSVMFRRDVIRDACGGFQGEYPCPEDYPLWIRVMRQFAVANLHERLVIYRAHRASWIGALQSPDSPNRERFVAFVRDLVTRQVQEHFTEIPADEAALLAGFELGIDAGDVSRFLSIFCRLLELYRAKHPESRGSADFHRTLAGQFDAIAYRIRGARRRDTFAVYRAALRVEPSFWRDVSWPRAAALVLFGREGRERLADSGAVRAARAVGHPRHG